MLIYWRVDWVLSICVLMVEEEDALVFKCDIVDVTHLENVNETYCQLNSKDDTQISR